MTVQVTPAGGSRGDVDPYDARLALRAEGLLRDFNQAGVLSAADVHVAQRLGRLGEEADEAVLLAAALAVRGVRLGSVCLDLEHARGTVSRDDESSTDLDVLGWPEPKAWSAACSASPLVAVGVPEPPGRQGRPLRLVDSLLYLDRYWRQEQVVRAELDARATAADRSVDPESLRRGLDELFVDDSGRPAEPPDRQRLAAAMTALRPLTVLAGGPGTGKTTTVARLLALLHRLTGEPRVALAAPTGKAAARLQEAVQHESQRAGLGLDDLTATTIHRLLGWRPDSRSRFRHDHDNRLPYDVVIIDETSMVSLTLMSRLLEAVRPDARLVLVGDPDQLASVEAGAVLGDLVERPAQPAADPPLRLAELVPTDLDDGWLASDAARNGVVRLVKTHRFGTEIGALAAAVRENRPDDVLALLRRGDDAVSFVETSEPDLRALGDVRSDVVTAASELTAAARAGEVEQALARLDRHRLLCAHRRGPYGVARWSAQVEQWAAEAIEGYAAEGEWYLGRPLLVDVNDYELELFNGDTGVVVDSGGRPTAAFQRGAGRMLVSPSRLAHVHTVHAMTVHRSQGSQFDRVTLVLPPPESPLLTRELLYTALTRAKSHVRVVGSAAAVRRAVSRPIVRASGLRRPSERGGRGRPNQTQAPVGFEPGPSRDSPGATTWAGRRASSGHGAPLCVP